MPLIKISRAPKLLIKVKYEPKFDLLFCTCIKGREVICVLIEAIPTKVIIPYNLVYILRLVPSLWNNLLWCDDFHLSSAYVCLPTQERIFCLTNTYSSRSISHHLRGIIYQNLQPLSLFPKTWIKSLVVFHADGSRVYWNKHFFPFHHRDGKHIGMEPFF